jgi:hypothetical protein
VPPNRSFRQNSAHAPSRIAPLCVCVMAGIIAI